MPLVLWRFIKHPFPPAPIRHSSDRASLANPGERKQSAIEASRKLSAVKAASRRCLLGQKVWSQFWLIIKSRAGASPALGLGSWAIFRQNRMCITLDYPRSQLLIQGSEQRRPGLASEHHHLPRLARRLSWGLKGLGDSRGGSQAQGNFHRRRHWPWSPTEGREVHLQPLSQNWQTGRIFRWKVCPRTECHLRWPSPQIGTSSIKTAVGRCWQERACNIHWERHCHQCQRGGGLQNQHKIPKL